MVVVPEQAEAERLYAESREHHRAARRHRARARELATQLRVLKEQAALRGIQIRINEPRIAQQGGHSGHQHRQAARESQDIR